MMAEENLDEVPVTREEVFKDAVESVALSTVFLLGGAATALFDRIGQEARQLGNSAKSFLNRNGDLKTDEQPSLAADSGIPPGHRSSTGGQ